MAMSGVAGVVSTSFVAAATVALYVNPGFRTLCNQVMSDVPGTALGLLCLVLERRVATSRSLAAPFGLGVLVGLSSLVRTVNVLIVPAVFVARLFHGQGARRRQPGR